MGKGKKGGKGGRNRKKVDAFEKKEWFRLKLPKIQGITANHYGWTPANKTAQGVLVEDRLKNRIVTIRCGDLEADPKPDKIDEIKTAINLKLRIADTRNQECWLDFNGMELTRDKTCSLLKKWVTLVEASVDFKTTDNFTFRVFSLAITNEQKGQCKNTAYAKTSQVKKIRAKMRDIMLDKFSGKSTKDFVKELLLGNLIQDELQKQLERIFPVKHAVIRKVKLIKRPDKENMARIDDLHMKDENESDEE